MTYQIINIEGRNFIVMWPYLGQDQLWLPVLEQYLKPCKIIGIAKKKCIPSVIRGSDINHFMHEIIQPLGSQNNY